jgi:hypothetical protein
MTLVTIWDRPAGFHQAKVNSWLTSGIEIELILG